MYWDVVEVKPEPNYRLFVRFKDGAAGYVRKRSVNTVFRSRPAAVILDGWEQREPLMR
jgi:hypothetical protein